METTLREYLLLLVTCRHVIKTYGIWGFFAYHLSLMPLSFFSFFLILLWMPFSLHAF